MRRAMTGPAHACSGGSYSAVEQAHTLRGVALGLSWNDIYLSGMEAASHIKIRIFKSS